MVLTRKFDSGEQYLYTNTCSILPLRSLEGARKKCRGCIHIVTLEQYSLTSHSLDEQHAMLRHTATWIVHARDQLLLASRIDKTDRVPELDQSWSLAHARSSFETRPRTLDGQTWGEGGEAYPRRLGFPANTGQPRDTRLRPSLSDLAGDAGWRCRPRRPMTFCRSHCRIHSPAVYPGHLDRDLSKLADQAFLNVVPTSWMLAFRPNWPGSALRALR